MKYLTKPDPHDEIERLALRIIEQCLFLHECETGTGRHRLTNAGRVKRLRRETVAKLAEKLKETAHE